MTPSLERETIPRAKDFLVDVSRSRIGPQLRDVYEQNLEAFELGGESGLIVRDKNSTFEQITSADLKLDGQIRNLWQQEFGDRVLWYSEESKAKELKKMRPDELREQPLVIVVDPIDGSGRLAKHSDRFSTSFALLSKGKVVLAVIYQPVGDTLWIAERDEQTVRIDARGERKVYVSNTTDLDKAYVSTAYPWNLKQRRQNAKTQRRLLPFVNQFAETASSVRDITDTAQALYDAFVCLGLQPWDMAGAAFAVVQSGGRVTRFRNEQDWHPYQPEIIASNGKIHDNLQRIANMNNLNYWMHVLYQLYVRKDIHRDPGIVHKATQKVKETVVYLSSKAK